VVYAYRPVSLRNVYDSLSRHGVNLTRRAAAPVYRSELCSRGHVYATRAVTRAAQRDGRRKPACAFLPSFPVPLSRPLESSRSSPATLSRPRWRFYGVFCDVRYPPSGARIVRRVLQRVLGRYLRHGAFAFGERYERISPQNVHVKSMKGD